MTKNLISKIKEVSQSIDINSYQRNNPTSNTFKRIAKHQRIVLESNNEEEVLKSAYKLKDWVWILINKTPHITEEQEKLKFNNIIDELGKLIEKE